MVVFFTVIFAFWFSPAGICIEVTSSNQIPMVGSSPYEIMYNNPKTIFVVLKRVEEIVEEKASIKKIEISINEKGDEGEVKLFGTTDPPNPKYRHHSMHIQTICKMLQQLKFVRNVNLAEARKAKYINIPEHGYGWDFRIDFKFIVEKCN